MFFMKKKTLIIIFTCLILVSFLVIKVAIQTRQQAHKSEFTGVGLKLSNRWMSATDKERMDMLEEWGVRITTEGVLRLFPDLRIPEETSGRKLLGMYISKGGTEKEKVLTLLYESDLHINIWRNETKPDYDKEIEESVKFKNEGTLKADKLPQKVALGNVEAIGADGGYNVISDIEKYPRPAYLLTWYNGVQYEIYGDSPMMKLDDLIQVAQSMF